MQFPPLLLKTQNCWHLALQYKFDKTADRMQGRPEFMRDVGNEVRLHLVKFPLLSDIEDALYFPKILISAAFEC